ncbi:MAG: DUF4105 domain-containing protein [Bacteroidales bacterium]
MMSKLKSILLLLIVITLATTNSIKGESNITDTDSIHISLITCDQGEIVYELFGHTAIRVQRGDKLDIVFNYGIFDFGAPNFIARFTMGQTDYKVVYYPFKYFVADYRERKISFYEQDLNLSQEQAEELLNLLLINAQPENATYRYSYIYKNCATQPRDLIEAVTDNSIVYPERGDTRSLRQIMSDCNVNYPWFQFGIDLALGGEIDEDVDNRTQMFAPMILMDYMRDATFIKDGERVNIVTAERALNSVDITDAILPPTPWYLSPMMVSLLILMITIAISIRDMRRGGITRWYDTVLFSIFGLLGMLSFFLIFISTHSATSPNYLAVWINPFCLIAAILIWIKPTYILLRFYHFINFALLIILIGMWWLIPQTASWAIFPLIACSAIRSFNFLYINRCAVNRLK